MNDISVMGIDASTYGAANYVSVVRLNVSVDSLRDGNVSVVRRNVAGAAVHLDAFAHIYCQFLDVALNNDFDFLVWELVDVGVLLTVNGYHAVADADIVSVDSDYVALALTGYDNITFSKNVHL